MAAVIWLLPANPTCLAIASKDKRVTEAEIAEMDLRGRERDEWEEDEPFVPLSPEFHRKFSAYVEAMLGYRPVRIDG